MTPSFERLQGILKRLPGLGHRSAERIALHLLLEKPDRTSDLLAALRQAMENVRSCAACGNVCESEYCNICVDENRDDTTICVVEQVHDLFAMEKAGSFRGKYLVLGGKLSPIHGIGPEDLNFHLLSQRLQDKAVNELILALANDIEGEATCHYIQEEIIESNEVKISRIGFGLPSGGGLIFADAVTLRSALEGRRSLRD